MYQVGTGTDTISNPFGLLLTGTAPAGAVPEPAQALPLGCVLNRVGSRVSPQVEDSAHWPVNCHYPVEVPK
jgi:hypothetical protein